MPELIEVEFYAGAVRSLIGQRLESVELPDPAYLRPPGASAEGLDALAGAELEAVRRIGKLLLLDLGRGEDATTLGLRFGMTGRILVDGSGPIEQLVYSTPRDESQWDRVVLFLGGARVAIRDPRRLGSIEVVPDESMLGPDAASLGVEDLAGALSGRTAPLKATLMNQSIIAGLGNLLVDEVLYRSGLAPTRISGQLDREEQRRLARSIRSTIRQLTDRGGSHTGDTFDAREPGATCPRDGAPMRRDRIGGRTTYWCPSHQR